MAGSKGAGFDSRPSSSLSPALSQSTRLGLRAHVDILEVLMERCAHWCGCQGQDRLASSRGPTFFHRLRKAFYCFSNINHAAGCRLQAGAGDRGISWQRCQAGAKTAWEWPHGTRVPLPESQHNGSYISSTYHVPDTSHPFSPFLI